MIRLIGYFFGIGTIFALIAAAAVAWYVVNVTEDLPDYEVLANYEPPVTTRFHAASGELMAEYARERRLFLPIQAIPDRVKAAFLSAEDKNFYSHPGIDPIGLARAIVVNVQNLGSGRRPVGASTITQQVAKNFLLSADQTIDRKVKEAILSFRIEQAYSKDRILELYLNEIFFGYGAYGIAGAALSYFDKSVNELTIAEAAYLAALPKAPSNYHPFRQTERAIERRDWVVDRMLENGYISVEEAREAKASPLGVEPSTGNSTLFASDYFAEEVRRQIISRYGQNALYEGGLSVRTTLNPQMHIAARQALHDGLIAYDESRGFRGPVDTVDISADWGVAMAEINELSDVPEWKLGVVLEANDAGATIGLKPRPTGSGEVGEDRETITLPAAGMEWAYRMNIDGQSSTARSPAGVLNPGDVVFVEEMGGENAGWRLRQPPEVQGALVAMDPHTGRVLALAGGFSYAQSEFNRATQAMRQPGSAFKPFVYAAALDNGYTPASVVMDAPIEVVSGNEVWRPKNYGGDAAGPSTLRLGIERSRNLMTVRLAQDMGMDLVAEYSERFGIYDNLMPYLPMSLGAGETTVLRLVSAYSVIANGGKAIEPSLIDRVQDRYGRTVFRHEERVCETCAANEWQGQEEPVIADNRQQVLDPMTAYQMTSMLEGVVTRGTAASAVNLGRPTAGKTGTTNEERDAWFVGYTPDLVTGVYMGFDNPRPMGRGSTGGGLAAPIFNAFMNDVLEGVPPADFRIPEGLNLIAIDRRTGMASNGQGGDVIMEAFKPGTGPAQDFFVIGNLDSYQSSEEIIQSSPQANRAVTSGAGGLY
ncbi:penicillin-binding protein 1A [Georhizobium profundi]|uniref:Penicillin-binding protein 1A n=1 Tax=Georhizobium profundi TaxID=2341112 RepID=A0A3S9B5G4_9HYPH|nr:penicillin-binding protein 1A [Georhizobium profundi]AZN72164.1 penicillin-binding protein 1A [Georhizobium profundi]